MNYPKSSCSSNICPYSNTILLSNSKIEPSFNKTSFLQLNPQAIQQKYPKDFTQTNTQTNISCNTQQYQSRDPRLISSTLPQQLTLDTPPLDSSINPDQVNKDPSLNNYGKNYTSYKDINAGTISYYIDTSIQDTFFNPLFSIPSYNTSIIYKDPMDSEKPQYYRTPVYTNNYIDLPNNKNFFGSLSWIQDSTSHREDIMARQMLYRNQSRYEPYHANLIHS